MTPPTLDYPDKLAEAWGTNLEFRHKLAHIVKTLQTDLSPLGFIECCIIDTMAINYWRQSRLRCFEKALLEAEAVSNAQMFNRSGESPVLQEARAFRSLADQSRAFSLIAREDCRCESVIANSLRLLADYRKAPPPSQTEPPANGSPNQ